jgi:hypothetical protein
LMRGRLPKDPELRQRRNKSASSATLSTERAPKRRPPKLPTIMEHRNGEKVAHEWHAMTRSWWRDVWRSPMAAEYLQADVHGLFRLAILVDRFWRTGSQALAAEIRLQQQCFGLTPIDRRRLQWEVERVEEVTSRKRKHEPPAGATEQPAAEDPRALLRVVK